MNEAATHVTDEDTRAAREAAHHLVQGSAGRPGRPVDDYYRVALESAFRPGGLVARAVIAALDEATARVIADCSHGDIRMGEWPAASCPFCQPKANSVAAVAAEWREGKR